MSNSPLSEINNPAHFGSIRKTAFDPMNDTVISLGEDDCLIQLFSASDLSVFSNNSNDAISNIKIRDFCFDKRWMGIYIVGENKKLLYFSWPSCSNATELFHFDNELSLISISKSEDFALVSDGNRVYLLKLFKDKDVRCELVKIVYETEDHVDWIGFDPKNPIFVVFDSNKKLTAFETTSCNVIQEIKIMQTTGKCLPCFTRKSDLIIAENEMIRVINFHKNQSLIMKYDDITPEITLIASSNSDYIVTVTKNNELIISEFDRSLFIYSENPQKTQILSIITKTKLNCENLTSINWCGNNVAAGDEEGTLHFWKFNFNIKPVKKQKENIVSEKQKDIIQSLNQTIIKKKEISEDESLEEISEEEERPKTIIKQENKKKKTNKKTKETKETKLKAKDFYLHNEEVSDEYDDSDHFIENNDDFEERINQITPKSPPLHFEEESFSSSDHEIDITEYLPKKEEESNQEENEETSSDSYDDNLDVSDIFQDVTFPFMPGNCDSFLGNRRYLCWNDYAAVLLRQENDGSQEIDIHKSDGKIESISNFNHFTIVAIDEYGMIGASESTLVYRHHKTWAPDNETSFTFDKEKIKLVACGKEWFSLATNTPCIRIFTSAGLEITDINIPFQCTVMIGRDKYLFYAYGPSLTFQIFDIEKLKVVVEGTITVKQPLKWIYITTDFTVFVQDDYNIIYKLTKDFSFGWVPVADLNESSDKDVDGFWPVKVDDTFVYYVPLIGTICPPTNPIPNPHKIETSILVYDKKVKNWLVKQINTGIKKHQQRTKLDAELLKLYSEAIQKEQYFKAFQIAHMFKTKKVRQFIIKYADESNARIVSDKLTGKIKQTKSKHFTKQSNKFTKQLQDNTFTNEEPEEKAVYIRNVSKNVQNTYTEPGSKVRTLFDSLKEIGENSNRIKQGTSVFSAKKKTKNSNQKSNAKPIVVKTRKSKKKEENEKFLPLFQ